MRQYVLGNALSGCTSRHMKFLFAVLLITIPIAAVNADAVRSGAAAFGDWRADAPGITRQIRPDALPAPFASASASQRPSVVARPAGANPRLPPGFEATVFASGLDQPRTMRTAPNGDIFVAEESGGRIRVLRTADGDAKPTATDFRVRPEGALWYRLLASGAVSEVRLRGRDHPDRPLSLSDR